MKVLAKAPTLHMTITTWQKDSHGLYDYQNTKNLKEYFQIQGPCKMFRNWHGAKTNLISNDKIKRGHLPDQTYTFVSSILLRHNGNCQTFLMSPPERPSQEIMKKEANNDQAGPMNTNAYIIVKDYKVGPYKHDGYPLSAGNIVKLGRVQYRVVEMGGFPKKSENMVRDLFLSEFNGIHQAPLQTKQGTCKFCLCDDNTQDNFLISPCKCKGSCQGVHVQCLKMWIDSKVKKQVSGMVASYNFTKFECQICKQPFPRLVTKGKNFQMQMITIQRPQKPYIILEGINQRKQSRQQRCLHVIHAQKDVNVKMGRGHQCQIRLQDISVSRMHSEIKFTGEGFCISDCHSKFGTLVKLDKTMELGHKVKLQVGRSVYSFQIQ